MEIPWNKPMAQDALQGQRFFARDGLLRITLPPLSGVILL